MKKKNNGFTLVEIVVIILIVAILAAIIIPVTLSMIDSSNEVEIIQDAKNIWTAAQSTFTEQAAKGEFWISTENGKNKLWQGMIFDQYQKTSNGTQEKKFLLADFYESCFLYIGNLMVGNNILAKIEKANAFSDIYIAAGRFKTYYQTHDEYPYNVYALIFKYSDDDTIYYFDGKNLSKEWMFSTPADISSLSGKEQFYVLKGNNIELQLYCLKNSTNSVKANEAFKSMVK